MKKKYFSLLLMFHAFFINLEAIQIKNCSLNWNKSNYFSNLTFRFNSSVESTCDFRDNFNLSIGRKDTLKIEIVVNTSKNLSKLYGTIIGLSVRTIPFIKLDQNGNKWMTTFIGQRGLRAGDFDDALASTNWNGSLILVLMATLPNDSIPSYWTHIPLKREKENESNFSLNYGESLNCCFYECRNKNISLNEGISYKNIEMLYQNESSKGKSDGWIKLDVNKISNYFVIWLNEKKEIIASGYRKNFINNLSSGSYYYIIDVGCSSSSNQVHLCSKISIGKGVEKFYPTNCKAEDGIINFANVKTLGGMPPFSYYIQDLNDNYAGEFHEGFCQNIKSGNYNFIAIDNNGCVGKQEIELLSPDAFNLVVHEIKHPCDKSDGYIKLAVTNEDTNELFTIMCSNTNLKFEEVRCNQLITFDNLKTGNYCMNIFSNTNSCELQKCITLSGSVSELNIHSDIILPTVGRNNGQLKVLVTGGKEPYQYNWSKRFKSFSSIPEGNYCLTVKDICGTTKTNCFDLKACELSCDISFKLTK